MDKDSPLLEPIRYQITINSCKPEVKKYVDFFSFPKIPDMRAKCEYH